MNDSFSREAPTLTVLYVLYIHGSGQPFKCAISQGLAGTAFFLILPLYLTCEPPLLAEVFYNCME